MTANGLTIMFLGEKKNRASKTALLNLSFSRAVRLPFAIILLCDRVETNSIKPVSQGKVTGQKPCIHAGLRRFDAHSHSTGEGCSAVFFLIFRPSVLPLCYPFLVVHLVHGSRAPIIEPRAKMGSHQRGGWGPVPRIEYIISGGRAQGEGTAEGLALPPR